MDIAIIRSFLSYKLPVNMINGRQSGGEKTLNAERKANSSELQKAFSSVYRDFFNTHDVVLSAPSVLTW